MLAVQDPKILSFVSDYKLNLLSPADMTDEELDRFTTSLREVMLFIKYSKDKAKLSEMLQKDEGFKNLDRKAANVINIVTGSKIEVNEEEEEVDMCEAIQGMLDDATLAGLQQGRQEGRQEGKQEGRQEEVRNLAMRMLSEGSATVEYISLITNLTVEEIYRLDIVRKAQA